MKAVNLLPREIRGRRARRGVSGALVAGAAVTLVVAAAIGGGFVLERSHAGSEQRQLTTARAELAHEQARQAKTPQGPQTVPPPAALGQQQSWQQALAGALATRAPLDDTLAQLARLVPANVTVMNLTLDGATVAGTPGSLTLQASAYSQLGVAQLLSRLTLVPELSQVRLGTNTADPTTGIVTFTVQAQLGSSAPAATAGAGTTTDTTTTSDGGSA